MGAGAQIAREHGAGESRRCFRSTSKLVWPVELEPARTPLHPPEGRAALPEGRAAASRIRAETRGVSLGGAFVACEQPFPVDTDLVLWLYPPDPPPRGPRVLRVLARVRWINSTPGELPRGFGVAFRSLTIADEMALHGSVSRPFGA